MSQKENYHLNLENSPPQFFNMEKNLPTPDNETVKKKLEYLEGILEMANKFETTKSLFDLKTFLKDNYQKFSELLDEIYHNKQSFEFEKIKCTYLEKKVSTLFENNNIEENKNKREFDVKRKKSDDLTGKVDQLTKELEELKVKNEKMKEQINKKDFFREYDFMCKEVEGLRKLNFNLTETIKKIQKQQNLDEDEEESVSTSAAVGRRSLTPMARFNK